MTTPPVDGTDRHNQGSVKTLVVRLEPNIHIQLTLIAQLRGSTITEEIRKALAAHIALVKENTDLVSQAESAMADIEREAAARREAIASLFGNDQTEVKPRTARGR
ncbi:hypothetical protein FHU41_001387 [Psychromicrobium silvestre]|uniref:Uncharacterized protein n=1 Tax=Psychromicrobium silvestre TaxID=1645614 RepID=A0A7Y9S7L0_9MICC|nr:hypothetical protein [Psychromicrobium silvestre]NYE95166.1 hypothetical protein [Psychromicrobium silvestre]